MSLRTQTHQEDLAQTLGRQLNLRDLRLAEASLAMCSPEATLDALATILEQERRMTRLNRGLYRPLTLLIWLLFGLWTIVSFEHTDWLTLIFVGVFVRVLLLLLRPLTTASRLRSHNARLIAGKVVRQAERRSLGAVLIIAESAFTHTPRGNEREVCREYLTSTLARVPTDELQALTTAQRRALRTLTYLALTSRDTANASLATAGLLVLSTLRDPGLRELAQKAEGEHPNEQVRAAALEYLAHL